MPIGIVNKQQFESEINKSSKDVREANMPARINTQVIEDKKIGRNNKPEVHDTVRNVIAQEALLGAKTGEVAKEFGVSPTSVAAYKHGATSTDTYNKADKKLKDRNAIFRDRIVRKAGRLSLTALDSITDDEFAKASLRDKSAVAKEMASVVRDMSLRDNGDSPNATANVQVIVHAPPMRKESEYIDGIVSVD